MKKSIIFLLAITVSFASFAQKIKGNTDLQKGGTVIASTFTCPMHPDVISDKPGKCSKCGMDLTLSTKEQMKASVMKSYNCPMHPKEVSDKEGKCPKCGMELKETVITSNKYSCPTHSSVVSDKPGKCAKCQKNLSLSPKEQMKTDVVKAYVCPMHPNEGSDKPGKCPECGMDLTKVKVKAKPKKS
jgi:hypothetical protein